MKYLLAVDIGTTSAKCLSVSADGKILSTKQSYYPTSFPLHGFAEQDPEVIYQGVLEIIKASVISSRECIGVCFSSAMHSLTAVDKNGSLLLPLIIWSDLRSKKQFRELQKKEITSRLCEITGTPVHPMTPLCKLLWLKEERPEISSSVHKFLSMKEFIFYRLTGKFVVDYSVASATGLFDLDKLEWSHEVLNLLALSPDKLSTPVPINEKIDLLESNALELGLDKNVPLIIGASDGCLAQLGSEAMNPGDLSITLGTSGAVRLASSKRLIDPAGKIFNYILRDGEYICGGPTNSGTAILNWFGKNFDHTSGSDLVKFVEKTDSISPGSDGLIMLPFLLGERAPIYDPDARGVFFGIAMHHTPHHFQRAVLEGICFEIAWITESLESFAGRSQRIFVSGGFTHSPKWVQMLSNILGRELILPESQDASSLGAAIIGFEALDIRIELQKPAIKTFTPDRAAHATYSKLFPIFKKLYSQTSELLKDLHKINE